MRQQNWTPMLDSLQNTQAQRPHSYVSLFRLPACQAPRRSADCRPPGREQPHCHLTSLPAGGSCITVVQAAILGPTSGAPLLRQLWWQLHVLGALPGHSSTPPTYPSLYLGGALPFYISTAPPARQRVLKVVTRPAVMWQQDVHGTGHSPCFHACAQPPG